MAIKELKYDGMLTLGKLELLLEAQEALFGMLIKLEALGGYTVATFDDSDYPPVSSLALLPMIGGSPPPTPASAVHLFEGKALVLGQPIALSVFRTH